MRTKENGEVILLEIDFEKNRIESDLRYRERLKKIDEDHAKTMKKIDDRHKRRMREIERQEYLDWKR